MKRKIALIIALAMVFTLAFCACGKEESKPEPTEEPTQTESGDASVTLESNLPLLEKEDWEKTDDGYLYSTRDGDCASTYLITASGNDADLIVTLTYDTDNEEMVDFYKDEKKAARGIVGYWYTTATDIAGVEEGSVNYTFKIAKTTVLTGTMSYDEAKDALDYFE